MCVAKKHVHLCNADLTGTFYVPASDNAECKVGEWQPKCGVHPGSRARESESQELCSRQWPGGMPEEGC